MKSFKTIICSVIIILLMISENFSFCSEISNIAEWKEGNASPFKLENGQQYRWYRTIDGKSAMTILVGKDEQVFELKIFDGNNEIYSTLFTDSIPSNKNSDRILIDKIKPVVPLINMAYGTTAWIFFDKKLLITYSIVVWNIHNNVFESDTRIELNQELIKYYNYLNSGSK